MASRAGQIERYPFHSAITLVVEASRKSRRRIAADVGVDIRTLQRWLNGSVPPPIDKWVRVLTVCDASPITFMILADSGRAGLIDTATRGYVDKLTCQITELVAEITAAGEISLDPRAARRDAQLLKESWRATYRRQQEFLDTPFAESGRPPP